MKRSILFPIFFLSFFSFCWAQSPLHIPDTVAGPLINLSMAPSSVSFYGSQTQTMGFNGDILGPTLILRRDDSVRINVFNGLSDTTTVHWHGMHVSPENDGGPHSIIEPGETWSKKIKVLDHASTFWYHPHMHAHTNEHVTKGLAGFIIVRDSLEDALPLPRTYGVDDFPLVVQTRDFDLQNQFLIGTAMDTAVLVNGTLDPILDVPAQIVRLRLLNGSSERVFNFGFSDGRQFQVIGSDGGLLAQPVTLSRLRLAPGERSEVLVDFSGAMGQTLSLNSFASQLPNGIYGAGQPGMGAGQTIPGYASNFLNGTDFEILQINVTAQLPNAITTVPPTLVPHIPWMESNADTTRSLTFTPQAMGPTAIQGPFRINGTFFDMNVINQTIPLGNTEVWTLFNQSPIAHPFHIHDVQFYILDIDGAQPPLHEQGRKDVVLVEPMSTVRFITRFEDFASDTMPYMYHCHMLTHEDEGMMHQFLVLDTMQTSTFEEISASRVKVYPNPIESGWLMVDFSSIQNIPDELSILDMTGRVVLKRELNEGERKVKILVGKFQPGLYSGVVAGNEKFYFFRLIVR